MRYIFTGGKGGVGKTVAAAGLAYHYASQGERVLLASLNPVHSLSSLFAQSLSGGRVVPVEGAALRVKQEPEGEGMVTGPLTLGDAEKLAREMMEAADSSESAVGEPVAPRKARRRTTSSQTEAVEEAPIAKRILR